MSDAARHTTSTGEDHTTVVVAHDDPTVKTTILTVLRADSDVGVVAHVESGETLLDVVVAFAPDLVLLASDLAHCDVIEACRHLGDEMPVCRVVVIWNGETPPPYEAATAGAAGAVSVTELSAHPAWTVRHSARGEAFIPPSWAAGLLDEFATLHDDPPPGAARPPRLTATEREVLRRLAKGTTADAVASLHEVPPRLVRLNAGLAMAKLARMHRDHRSIRTND